MVETTVDFAIDQDISKAIASRTYTGFSEGDFVSVNIAFSSITTNKGEIAHRLTYEFEDEPDGRRFIANGRVISAYISPDDATALLPESITGNIPFVAAGVPFFADWMLRHDTTEFPGVQIIETGDFPAGTWFETPFVQAPPNTIVQRDSHFILLDELGTRFGTLYAPYWAVDP